jgi:N-methylhydantoinase B
MEFAVGATVPHRQCPQADARAVWTAPRRGRVKSGKTLRTKGFQVIPDGDRLILKLPGGAGMGDPTARDPNLVARDVRDGLVSADSANTLYKVSIADEGEVDADATAKLRS